MAERDPSIDGARERFEPSYPTVRPDPVPTAPASPDCCGNCPGWKQANPRAPFGQCLPAIKWLGAPMYTPNGASCSLPMEDKAKGAAR